MGAFSGVREGSVLSEGLFGFMMSAKEISGITSPARPFEDRLDSSAYSRLYSSVCSITP